MNINEYKEKINSINKKAEIEKDVVIKEFALSNNTVAIGDVIADRLGKIIVTKILIYRSEIPRCIYRGYVLKKNGEITKRQEVRVVYEVLS